MKINRHLLFKSQTRNYPNLYLCFYNNPIFFNIAKLMSLQNTEHPPSNEQLYVTYISWMYTNENIHFKNIKIQLRNVASENFVSYFLEYSHHYQVKYFYTPVT